jgi:hypothetical protein
LTEATVTELLNTTGKALNTLGFTANTGAALDAVHRIFDEAA